MNVLPCPSNIMENVDLNCNCTKFHQVKPTATTLDVYVITTETCALKDTTIAAAQDTVFCQPTNHVAGMA